MVALADPVRSSANPARPPDARTSASPPVPLRLVKTGETPTRTPPTEDPFARTAPAPRRPPSSSGARWPEERATTSRASPFRANFWGSDSPIIKSLTLAAKGMADVPDLVGMLAAWQLAVLSNATAGMARLAAAGSDFAVSEHRVHTALDPTIQRIARFSELKPDWDSYGAKVPTPQALDAAARYLKILVGTYAPFAGDRAMPFWVSPLPNGGVQLEWRGPEAELEIEVDPEGRLGYLLQEGHGPDAKYEEDDSAPFPSVLPLLGRVVLP